MELHEIVERVRADLQWGLEVGDGWLPLVETAVLEVDRHVRETGCEPVLYRQIKEKFGHLTIYSHGGDEYARGILSCAQALGSTICERTGKPGKLVVSQGGYYATLAVDVAFTDGFRPTPRRAPEPGVMADEDLAAAFTRGPVECPVGWRHVVDAYRAWFGRHAAARPPGLAIQRIGLGPRGLEIELTGAADFVRGGAALLETYCRRLDQRTGVPVV